MDTVGTESGQHVRTDHSASLTNQASSGSRDTADLSRSADLRQRGSTQTVSRVDSSQNLMTPDNLQRVAARNGMRYSQLMTLPEGELARLVREDASMRDLVTSNSTLPSTARDGSALPARSTDIIHQNQRDRNSVGTNVPAAYQGYSGAVGPVDTTPLDVKTPMPEVVTDAQQRVATMRQRVATDSASPIKQVHDNVDPSNDNKPLMTPERAPGRPLSPADRQSTPVEAGPSMGVWTNDRSAPPVPGRGSEASTVAVEKFLHPVAPAQGPTIEAVRAGTSAGVAGSPSTNSRPILPATRRGLPATEDSARTANTSPAEGVTSPGRATNALPPLSEASFRIVPLDSAAESTANVPSGPAAARNSVASIDTPMSAVSATTAGTSTLQGSAGNPTNLVAAVINDASTRASVQVDAAAIANAATSPSALASIGQRGVTGEVRANPANGSAAQTPENSEPDNK